MPGSSERERVLGRGQRKRAGCLDGALWSLNSRAMGPERPGLNPSNPPIGHIYLVLHTKPSAKYLMFLDCLIHPYPP